MTRLAVRVVEFSGADGRSRTGRLYGSGTTGIVLSHMGRAADRQQDWDGLARHLAGSGHQVLTYDRRSSFSRSWAEVIDAASYLHQQGAARVVVGGASIGAMASLRAVQEPGSSLAGVIWLAGFRRGNGYRFRRSDVAQVVCPLLFVSGEGDHAATADSERLYGWATPPKELLIVDSSAHGTDILHESGKPAAQVRRAVVAFVDRVSVGGADR
jgi:pimeloyl-ACP methyl ester carboxylesterase